MPKQDVAKGAALGALAFMIIHAVVAAVWRRVILSSTYEDNGFGTLPVCIAKTHLSISGDASLKGAPTGHTLTVLAEATLERALEVARERIERRFGAPEQAQIAVLGLGRLGSREMGFASDLDLLLTRMADVFDDTVG